MSDSSLQTGDIIMLKVRLEDPSKKNFSAFVCSDGIVGSRVSVLAFENAEDAITDIRDCLFKVVTQCSYHALKDVERLAKTGDPDNERSALEEKLASEEEQNAERAAAILPVNYGDVTQLLHVKSNQFLRVQPRMTGETERRARCVELGPGSNYAAFTVQPFYKYKYQGEPIKFQEQFLLQCAKLGERWHVHTRMDKTLEGAPPGCELHELNCSTDQNGFFPILYSRGHDVLSFSATIRIFHPQQERLLGASCGTKETLQVVNRMDGKASSESSKRPFLRRLEEDNLDHVRNLWGKGVFVLESLDMLQGGAVTWNAKLRVKHLATAKYLAVEIPAGGGTPDKALTCLKDSADDNCVFCLDPVEDTGSDEVLLDEGRCKALLKFNGGGEPLWLGTTPDWTKKADDSSAKPSLQLVFLPMRRIREALQIDCLDIKHAQYVADINKVAGWRHVVLDASHIFAKDNSEMQGGTPKIETSGDVQTEEMINKRIKAEKIRDKKQALFLRLEAILSQSIRFLTLERAEDCPDALKCSKESDPPKQEMMRELKYTDCTNVLADALQRAGYKVTSLSSRAVIDIGLGLSPKEPEALTALEFRCLRLLVEFWRASFQDNRTSENYFDKNGWLHVINNLNGLGLGAATCLAALVGNNRAIAMKIPEDVIQQFADFISLLGPDATWLNFFQAVCSCEGYAIESKQQLVLRMLYNQGPRATTDVKQKWGENRKKLLLAWKVGKALGEFPPVPVEDLAGEFLGKNTVLQEGLRELYVSWHCKKGPWEINKDWLYFHPEHLNLDIKETEGGRFWVAMSDVTWVMSPERLYKKDDWAEKGDEIRNSGLFKALEVLSQYCLAQILLLKEMCLDRHITCILCLEQEYHFDLICHGMWNSGLAPQLRAAFCELFDNLWLDRHPHGMVQLPDLVLKWQNIVDGALGLPCFELLDSRLERRDSNIQGTSAEQNFYSFKEPTKFNLLVAYVRNHLQKNKERMVYSQEGDVQETSSAADMLLNLMGFGFVSTEEQLSGMISLIIAVLDGRIDWLEAPAGEPGPTIQVIQSALDGAAAPNGESGLEEPLLAENTQGSSSPLFACCKEEGNGLAMTGGGPIPLYFGIPAEGGSRYEAEGVVVAAKLHLCQVLNKALQIVANYDVQEVLKVFHNAYDSGNQFGPETITKVIDVLENSAWNFDKLGGVSLNTLLCDIMMYEEPDLFVCATTAIDKLNHRIAGTLDFLSEIRLLCDDEEVQRYNKMKKDVSRLSNLFHTYEDWGVDDAFGEIDNEKYKEALAILVRLRQQCSDGGEGTDTETPEETNQDLLANLGLSHVLVHAFSIPIEQLQSVSKDRLTELMKKVCHLIVQYITGHDNNQKDMFDSLDSLLSWFSMGVGVANVIAAVFQDNIKLCELMPEEVVFQFGRVLVQNHEEGGRGFQPSQLTFLQSVVVIGQRPVVRNKQIVLDMLKNKAFHRVLHLINSDEDATPAKYEMTKEKCEKLLTNFQSWEELVKPKIFRQFKGDDAELWYHINCLELLAMLCIGRDRSGATEFVQFMVPARTLAAMYLGVHATQAAELKKGAKANPNCSKICRSIKKTLLLLIEGGFYDTELKDLQFLSSGLHFQMLATMHEELKGDIPRLAKAEMTAVGEDFVFQAVRTFNSLLEYTDEDKWEAQIPKLIKEEVHTTLENLSKPEMKFKTKSNSLFKTAVNRCLAWITGNDELKTQRLVEIREDTGTLSQKAESLNAGWKAFKKALKKSEIAKVAIAKEHCTLIEHFSGLGEITNTTATDYSAELRLAQKQLRRLRMDFRRNQIKTEELVQRAVNHCLTGDNLEKNWDLTKFVIVIVSDLLKYVKDPKLLMSTDEDSLGEDDVIQDPDALHAEQFRVAQRGAVNFVIQTLMAKPDSEVVQEALQLGTLLLEPHNSDVQQIFVDQFYMIDDWGLWDVIRGIYDGIASNVKNNRVLKALERKSGLEVLTEDEQDLVRIFKEDLETASRVMYLLSLFCEGHNSMMQQYIFRQVDNTVSWNFVEMTVQLVQKLCKNQKASAEMDADEMVCFTKAWDLLTSMTTGPEPRNQLFLSTSGLVEAIQKVITCRFNLIRTNDENDDNMEEYNSYPASVRRAKSRMVGVLLSMLETRPDDVVHLNIIYRLDAYRLKNRIVFIHRWFLSKFIVGNDHGGARAPHITDENGLAAIDSSSGDDGIELPDDDCMTLVEPFGEADLSDMFDEAFTIMMTMRELSPKSEKFKGQVSSDIPKFKDDRALYVSEAKYNEAKSANLDAIKYNAAFHFFDRWINSIEVLIGGKVFCLHFRMPVICDFVLGKTKEEIENSVTIESPEDKAKDFVEQCMGAFSQTLHTRALSKWSPSMSRCLPAPPKPLNFFLKNDSANLTAFEEYCLIVSFLLNFALIYALELDPVTGMPEYKEPDLETGITFLGVLYLMMITCAFLVVEVTYAPLEYRGIASKAESNPAGWPMTILGLFVACSCVGAGTALGHRTAGIFCAIMLVLHLSGTWAADGGQNCPNNIIAKLLSMVSMMLSTQAIVRRLFFLVMCLVAVLGFPIGYTFLPLDILFQSPMLQNVIKAVTVPAKPLALTTLVGIIVMYEYAVIAFYYFRSDYDKSCSGMVDCTTTTIYQGLRMDIGSAIAPVSVMEGNWYARMLFDLSFFVVITTVLMNVIFGIIIDTFGALRDETQERDGYFKNNTFIACLDRSDLDAAAADKGISSGWDYLENPRNGKQNRWMYMNFMFYLSLKDANDFSGAETAIHELLEDGEVSWLPLNTASIMVAEEATAEGPSEVEKKIDSLQSSHTELLATLEEIKSAVQPAN